MGSNYSALSSLFKSTDLRLEAFIFQTVEEKTVGCYDSARRKCIIKLLERKVDMSKKCMAQRRLRPTQRSTTNVHRLAI